jgi:hypothetical protein
MLPLAGDIAARFEAGSDRSVGDGRAQHPVDCEGGKEGSLTTHRLIDVPDQRSFTFEAPEPDRARHRADVGSEQWRRACYVRRARLAGADLATAGGHRRRGSGAAAVTLPGFAKRPSLLRETTRWKQNLQPVPIADK